MISLSLCHCFRAKTDIANARKHYRENVVSHTLDEGTHRECPFERCSCYTHALRAALQAKRLSPVAARLNVNDSLEIYLKKEA